MMIQIGRWLYYGFVWSVFKLFMPYKIEGWDNLPDRNDGPFLLVANHFTVIDGPLLVHLLLSEKLRVMASPHVIESSSFVAWMYYFYQKNFIYVDRGRTDRQALQSGLESLKDGNWLLIFPEGGITPVSIEAASRGEADELGPEHNFRSPAELLEPKPGAAMFALQSNVRIVPIASWGTEDALKRLKAFQRPRITVKVGVPFAPPDVPDGTRGRKRRAYLDETSEKIMYAIAELMPEQYRGPYQVTNN